MQFDVGWHKKILHISSSSSYVVAITITEKNFSFFFSVKLFSKKMRTTAHNQYSNSLFFIHPTVDHFEGSF